MEEQKIVKDVINYLKSFSAYAPVSAIIPCYNNEGTIKDAILSVTNQSWRPEELIIINDASTDKTLKIINKIKKEIGQNWIKIINLDENHGPSSARNIGWDKAAQPYIAFLDGDDAWNRDKIAIQTYYLLSNKEIDFCGHKYSLNKTEDRDFSDLLYSEIKIKEIQTKRWLFRNYYSTPGVIIKRQLLYRFPTFKRYCEDYFLWLQIAFDGHKMMLIDLPLAYGAKMYFGEKGLSKNIWKMGSSYLEIFPWLFKQRKISFPMMCLVLSWSFIKYARRVVITYFWEIYCGIKSYIR